MTSREQKSVCASILFALALLASPEVGAAQDAEATEALRARARTAFDAGQYDEAASLYEQLTRAAPLDASAWAGLGAARLGFPEGYAPPLAEANEHARAAVEAYDRSVALEPSSAALHVALAEALRRAGDSVRAHAELEAALRIDPAQPSTLAALAAMHDPTQPTVPLAYVEPAVPITVTTPERRLPRFALSVVGDDWDITRRDDVPLCASPCTFHHNVGDVHLRMRDRRAHGAGYDATVPLVQDSLLHLSRYSSEGHRIAGGVVLGLGLAGAIAVPAAIISALGGPPPPCVGGFLVVCEPDLRPLATGLSIAGGLVIAIVATIVAAVLLSRGDTVRALLVGPFTRVVPVEAVDEPTSIEASRGF